LFDHQELKCLNITKCNKIQPALDNYASIVYETFMVHIDN